MHRVNLVAIGLFTSVILGSSFLAKPSYAHPPRCYTVWVGAEALESGKAHERRGRKRGKHLDFSAARVLDLDFYVLFPAKSPPNIDLQIYTPQGHLYQTVTVNAPAPVEVEAKKSKKKAKSRRRKAPRFLWGMGKLPVAGTTIVNNSLYGEWSVVASVQGDTSPCAKPRRFEINP